MAAAANITISGSIIGEPMGSLTLGPVTVTSAAANWTIQNVVLIAGNTTITTPVSPVTSGVVIVLPTGNTFVTTLKGVGGDTGTAIGTTGPQLLYWGASTPPVSFVLSSTNLQTSPTAILFF